MSGPGFPRSAYTSGHGASVPRHRRNPRRGYDREGRETRPMDLANAATNDVRAVRAICPCGHEGEVSIDRFPSTMAVRDVGLYLRCSACGQKGPETEPVWQERRELV